MEIPDKIEKPRLSHFHAASQREAGSPALVRERGPHPLPVFLASVAATCDGDVKRLDRVLAGLRRYQAAPPAPPRRKAAIVAQAGTVTLRDHASGQGRPVVLVPSLINSPDVLDLASGNSLVAALAAAGYRPLIVDWGDTEPHGLGAAVSTRLVPLVAGLGIRVAMVGYCLGGTLAVAAATLLGDRVSRLALMATPWHFRGYDAKAHAGMADWWAAAAPIGEQLGSVPMELLQPAFWSLDPAALAEKFARFGEGDGSHDDFVRLEDWANGGAPLSMAATRDLAETLFAADETGRGTWTVGGIRIDPAGLTCPVLDIIATRDRIVPADTAISAGGPGTPFCIDAGHVGMVVGSRAPAALWQPLATWLHA